MQLWLDHCQAVKSAGRELCRTKHNGVLCFHLCFQD